MQMNWDEDEEAPSEIPPELGTLPCLKYLELEPNENLRCSQPVFEAIGAFQSL